MCYYTVRQYAGCGHSREDMWFTCQAPNTCNPEERAPPEEGGARSQPQRGVCPDCEERGRGHGPGAPPQRDGRGRVDDYDDGRRGRQRPPFYGPGGMRDPRYGGQFGHREREGEGFDPEDDDLDSPRGFGGRSPGFPPRGFERDPRAGQRPDFDGRYGDEYVYDDAPRPNDNHRRRRRPIRPGYYRLDRDAERLDVLETTDGNRYVQVRPRRNRRHGQSTTRHEGTMCCVQ